MCIVCAHFNERGPRALCWHSPLVNHPKLFTDERFDKRFDDIFDKNNLIIMIESEHDDRHLQFVCKMSGNLKTGGVLLSISAIHQAEHGLSLDRAQESKPIDIIFSPAIR